MSWGQILAMQRASSSAQALVDIVFLEGVKFIETIETYGSEISALANDVKGNCALNVKSFKVLWMVIKESGLCSFL